MGNLRYTVNVANIGTVHNTSELGAAIIVFAHYVHEILSDNGRGEFPVVIIDELNGGDIVAEYFSYTVFND